MMRKRFAACLIGVLVASSQIAVAQTPQELREEELLRARAEMEQARRQLEQSARVLATQAEVLPNVERNLNFLFTNDAWFGNRAQIGLSVVDAENGALVTSLVPDGSAEEVGIKVGDVILSINGSELAGGEESPNGQLVASLREVEPGDTVDLVVERAGETLEFDVETGEGSLWTAALPGVNRDYARVLRDFRQDGGVNFLVDPSDPNEQRFTVNTFRPLVFAYSPWSDMELVTVTEGLGRYFDADEGLLVVRSPEDDSIDIQDGDVILSVSGRTPNSPEHAIRILSSFEAGETIEFSLMRDGRRESVEYQIPESNFQPAGTRQVFPVPVE